MALQQDVQERAIALRALAQSLRAQSRHAEALDALEQAARIAEEAKLPLLAAQVQIGRIDSLGWLGRYDEAFALGASLIATFRAQNAESEAARVQVNLGILHYRRDQYAEALAQYQEAAAIFRAQNDSLSLARLQVNEGNALTALHRIEEAIAAFEAARAVFQAEGLAAFAAIADLNQGYLHFVSGRYPLALAFFDQARQQFTLAEDNEGCAQCDLDTGDVYRALNLYPEAEECYRRAIGVFTEIAAPYDLARAELGQAAVAFLQGQIDRARDGLARAEQVFRAQRNAIQQAYVRFLRAHLLYQEGDAEAAVPLSEQAGRTFVRKKMHGWAAEARFLAADVALEQGENASRRMHRIARQARAFGRGWLECRAEHALGRYFARQNLVGRALRHLRRGVAALEQARTLIAPEEMHVAYLRDKLAVYEDTVRTLLRRGRKRDLAEALEYVERAKSRLLLEKMLSALEAPADAAAQSEARQQLTALRAELSRGYFDRQPQGGASSERRLNTGRADLNALLEAERNYQSILRALELRQRAGSGGAFALNSVVSTDALQYALRPDETLVEFYLMEDSYCAFVVTRESVRFVPGLASAEEIARLARRLEYQLRKAALLPEYTRRYAGGLAEDARAVLRQLYDRLLRPLEHVLATGALALIPHGALHGLPFHAFYDGMIYALERWEFVSAPSAGVWHAGVCRKQTFPGKANLPALLVGVPAPTLDRVLEEVEHLSQIMPGSRALCGSEATLEAFRAEAGRAARLHLATHALFRSDNPLFSGLQFADGWLLARDLYTMRLRCDLATLSACRTGLAFVEAGDELFGLLRGFLAAGARSVVASLWPVEDAATAQLMVQFYGSLQSGKGKAAALRAAQITLSHEYVHPYYWSAFLLVGER